ncbi:DUF1549 domain-containing protein [Anatilimnocola sp. NA78]|uniref:DUF1549 domain-containing protein n=1 Tax=Anatilimnocola sp. NA78 TaxID=3415683 RepID=UPI003CE54D5D
MVMLSRQVWICSGLVLSLFVPVITLAESPSSGELAAKIDQHLASAWQRAGLQPAAVADEATFLRRVYLDLVGRIPTAAETQAYLADARPERRALLVEQLISSGGYARHFATVWRRIWIPQADTQEFARLTGDFEAWAAVRIRDNVPYDTMVEQLLLAARTQPVVQGKPNEEVNPIGFQAASLFRAENLAANTTRAFLGLNLDCAQCHDHPFSRWTRDQFWETAAFFAAPQKMADSQVAVLEVKIPETDRRLRPKLLDNETPDWPAELATSTGPKVLAAWITDKENPYFARNAVNRMWAQFFGRGLIEPLDDISEENPSSLPALHQELADAFVASGYDLKFLTRALVNTRAYQFSTIAAGPSPPEELHLFEKMPVRGLTGEQLYDSMVIAAGLPTVRNDLLSSSEANRRAQFTTLLHVERVVDAERSIVQALTLMNGELSRELTTPEKTPLLAAAADSPFLSQTEKVEMLFFAALNRRPNPAETKQLLDYVANKELAAEGEQRSERAALADVFWVLLNSSEFNTNH